MHKAQAALQHQKKSCRHAAICQCLLPGQLPMTLTVWQLHQCQYWYLHCMAKAACALAKQQPLLNNIVHCLPSQRDAHKSHSTAVQVHVFIHSPFTECDIIFWTCPPALTLLGCCCCCCLSDCCCCMPLLKALDVPLRLSGGATLSSWLSSSESVSPTTQQMSNLQVLIFNTQHRWQVGMHMVIKLTLYQ